MNMKRSELKTIIEYVKAAPDGWSADGVWWILDEKKAIENMLDCWSGEDVTAYELREQLNDEPEDFSICEHGDQYYVVNEKTLTYFLIENPENQWAVNAMSHTNPIETLE